MNIVISFFSQVPIYEQIKNQIKEMILTENLKPMQQLPSIRLMAKELKVSVITVKRAYEELEREEIITTLHGRGCFIRDINIEKVKTININVVKKQLTETIQFAKASGISEKELQKLLTEIYSWGESIR